MGDRQSCKSDGCLKSRTIRYALAITIGGVFPLLYWFLSTWTSVLWISWGHRICVQWGWPEWCYWSLPPWLAVHVGVALLPSRTWGIAVGPVLFLLTTANNWIYHGVLLSGMFGVTEWQESLRCALLNVEWDAIPAATVTVLGTMLLATRRRKQKLPHRNK